MIHLKNNGGLYEKVFNVALFYSDKLCIEYICGYRRSLRHSLIGQPGNPAQVSRTIEIKMIENRFLPHEITIRQGETIRFLVKNEGKKHHEFTIDTIKNLKEHAKMMRAHPDMLHNEPNQLKVAPGEQKELIWHFTETGIVDFACPYPGHFKGMQGKIYVEKK